jgi:hypothetical protein
MFEQRNSRSKRLEMAILSLRPPCNLKFRARALACAPHGSERDVPSTARAHGHYHALALHSRPPSSCFSTSRRCACVPYHDS